MRASSLRPVANSLGVEFVGFFDALVEHRVKCLCRNSSFGGASGSAGFWSVRRRRMVQLLPRREFRAESAPRLSFPSLRDSRRRVRRRSDSGGTHPSRTALPFFVPNSRSRFVSFSVKSSLRSAFDQQPAFAVMKFSQLEKLRSRDGPWNCATLRRVELIAPVPAIAKPQRGQQMQSRGVRPAIPRRDAHQDIFEGRPSRIRRTHRSSGFR